MKQMARRIMKDTGMPYGFVFQGADYEGGVANALEFIWNAGGRVMTLNLSVMGEIGQNMTDPNIITVDSKTAAHGLEIARSMITEGIAPEAVSNYHEVESREAFLSGKAVFMRHWPYVHQMTADPEQSEIRPEQVGLAALPFAAGQKSSYSCLGGWNLMVNKRSSANARKALSRIKFCPMTGYGSWPSHRTCPHRPAAPPWKPDRSTLRSLSEHIG